MATTTNTLRLQLGRRYLARDGKEVLIDDFDADPMNPYPFAGVHDDLLLTWKPDGTFIDSRPHNADLVSEIPDVAPEYRYFRFDSQDRNIDGQDMRWRVAPGARPEACDTREGVWRTSAHGDAESLETAAGLIECHLDGTLLTVPTPEYRYFRRVDEARTDRYFCVWRFYSADRPIEGKLPNRPGDDWQDTTLDLVKDLLSDPNIIECDADRFILGRPEPEPGITEDLTSAHRTRIAKLAARIVLADGPVLTVDELAGMTVGELVAQLGETEIYSI